MTRSRSLQALRYLGSSLLLLCVFEACSSNDTSAPDLFHGPPTLEITGISLGSGTTGQGGDSGVLACDGNIGVTLAITNWTLYPPGKCDGAVQCGQVRITLLDGPKGAELGSQLAASLGVNLNVSKLVASGDVKAGNYAIQADLVDDAGKVYAITDGGNSSAEQAFSLALPAECASGTAGAGLGGAAGEGGVAGFGGTPDVAGQGGASAGSAGN